MAKITNLRRAIRQMKRQTKLEKAITDTMHMYEEMMDIHTDICVLRDAWRKQTCRVCTAMGKGDNCPQCPLYCSAWRYGCADGMDGFAMGSKDMINDADGHREIRKAVRARYRELLRRLKANGWTYE